MKILRLYDVDICKKEKKRLGVKQKCIVQKGDIEILR